MVSDNAPTVKTSNGNTSVYEPNPTLSTDNKFSHIHIELAVSMNMRPSTKDGLSTAPQKH